MNTHIRLLILCILSISATLGIVFGALFATGTLSSKSDDDNGEQVEDYPLAYQNFYEFDNGLETGNITTASSSNGTTDVIIIGLGLAGLAAAQTLGHSNLRVHVLEAMSRPGGRVFTTTFENSVIELGAQWIIGSDHNPLYSLSSISRVSRAKSERSGPNRFLQEMIRLSSCSNSKRMNVSSWCINPADAMDDDMSLGGMQNMTSFIHNTLDSMENIRIDFNAIVTDISAGQGMTTVFLNDSRSISAPFVLSTIPIGVLQSGEIHFNPPLPTQVYDAIHNIQSVATTTVHLKFSSPFWGKQHYYSIPMEDSDTWLDITNIQSFTGESLLVIHPSHAASMRMENQSDTQVVAEIMDSLSSVFEATPTWPESFLISRWGLHPFARGSFSVLTACSLPNDRATLREPVGGGLLIAGEAVASKSPGTLQGAYLSGLEQAERILDAIRVSREGICITTEQCSQNGWTPMQSN